MEAVEAHADWRELSIKIRIKNTGSVPGRETAQLYVTAPEGRLTKPYQELKAYQKTRLLQPGESEILTLVLPTESLASYDEEKAAFVMEPKAPRPMIIMPETIWSWEVMTPIF